MKKWFFVCIAAILLLTTCAAWKSAGVTATEADNSVPGAVTEEITFTQLSNSIWIQTTYGQYNGSEIPANGLVILTSEGAVLVDTPWDDALTTALVEKVKEVFDAEVSLAVITHAHVDRMGGIDALLENGTAVVGTPKIADSAQKNGFTPPTPTLEDNALLEIGGQTLEVFYPGPGHTADNITVFLPEEGILFAGCLVKSADAETAQLSPEASREEWGGAIKRVQEKYPEVTFVVPGHGGFGGPELLPHTMGLLFPYDMEDEG